MSSKKEAIRWGRSILFAKLEEAAKAGKPILKIQFEHLGSIYIDELCVDFNQRYFTTIRTSGWDDALFVYISKSDMKDLIKLLQINGFEDITPTGK